MEILKYILKVYSTFVQRVHTVQYGRAHTPCHCNLHCTAYPATYFISSSFTPSILLSVVAFISACCVGRLLCKLILIILSVLINWTVFQIYQVNPKLKMAGSTPSHPKYSDMIIQAILANKAEGNMNTSRQAILKFITTKYGIESQVSSVCFF